MDPSNGINLRLNPLTFRIVARTVALCYVFPSLIIFPLILAFANRPWANNEYLVAAIGLISIIGLLLGLKWQGLGGLIAAIFPMWLLIGVVRNSFEHETGFDPANTILRVSLLLFIPCIIYVMSWFLNKREKLIQ